MYQIGCWESESLIFEARELTCAATGILPASRISIAILKPSPSFPKRFPWGMSTSWKYQKVGIVNILRTAQQRLWKGLNPPQRWRWQWKCTGSQVSSPSLPDWARLMGTARRSSWSPDFKTCDQSVKVERCPTLCLSPRSVVAKTVPPEACQLFVIQACGAKVVLRAFEDFTLVPFNLHPPPSNCCALTNNKNCFGGVDCSLEVRSGITLRHSWASPSPLHHIWSKPSTQSPGLTWLKQPLHRSHYQVQKA